MAVTSSPQPTIPRSTISTSKPLSEQDPIPLSASQEVAVREIYHKRVRAKCADEIREFATCVKTHPFLATFKCRPQHTLMNSCMMAFANQAEQDAAREEWYAGIEARRREREAKEVRRKEQEKFHIEWWSREDGKNTDITR